MIDRSLMHASRVCVCVVCGNAVISLPVVAFPSLARSRSWLHLLSLSLRHRLSIPRALLGTLPDHLHAPIASPSGIRLARALLEGIKALNGDFLDMGEMTTPQLHYMVSPTRDVSSSVNDIQGSRLEHEEGTGAIWARYRRGILSKVGGCLQEDCGGFLWLSLNDFA